MTLEIVIVALSFVICVQQLYFMRQVQKLVDKLMSRSYHEYVAATKEPAPRVQIQTEPVENLDLLADYITA